MEPGVSAAPDSKMTCESSAEVPAKFPPPQCPGVCVSVNTAWYTPSVVVEVERVQFGGASGVNGGCSPSFSPPLKKASDSPRQTPGTFPRQPPRDRHDAPMPPAGVRVGQVGVALAVAGAAVPAFDGRFAGVCGPAAVGCCAHRGPGNRLLRDRFAGDALFKLCPDVGA